MRVNHLGELLKCRHRVSRSSSIACLAAGRWSCCWPRLRTYPRVARGELLGDSCPLTTPQPPAGFASKLPIRPRNNRVHLNVQVCPPPFRAHQMHPHAPSRGGRGGAHRGLRLRPQPPGEEWAWSPGVVPGGAEGLPGRPAEVKGSALSFRDLE